MQPIKPKVEVPGDRVDKVMAQTGWIVGSRVIIGKEAKVVWCFGFLPNTIQAKAYGVSVEKQLWALCDEKGSIIEIFFGLKKDLPRDFKKAIYGKNIFIVGKDEDSNQ